MKNLRRSISLAVVGIAFCLGLSGLPGWAIKDNKMTLENRTEINNGARLNMAFLFYVPRTPCEDLFDQGPESSHFI